MSVSNAVLPPCHDVCVCNVTYLTVLKIKLLNALINEVSFIAILRDVKRNRQCINQDWRRLGAIKGNEKYLMRKRHDLLAFNFKCFSHIARGTKLANLTDF